jgi:Fic family protein
MTERKVHRLWKPIAFGEEWRGADTSILDDLSSSWFARKARLRLESKEYQAFLDRLKREHAIETGVVERLYDIDRGVTETLIQQGFVDGLLSHGDANIPSDQLMLHLKDHLEAMDFVFDLIKENRPLTVGFIKELHQLVTRNQQSAEGRDGQGNRIKIPLLRGVYKERENNPTRSDGTVILYCDPVHVASEMDQLVNIYHVLEDEKVHPLIIASWVHHAFTTIHPFQDGNGRVVRLLASLILIKHDLFPITVLREEARLKYITALEKADVGEPYDLVAYFAVIQKRQIERALNLEEVVPESLDEVQRLLVEKIEGIRSKAEWEAHRKVEYAKLIDVRRHELFTIFREIINSEFDRLKLRLKGKVNAFIREDTEETGPLNSLIEGNFINDYGKHHGYEIQWLVPRIQIYNIEFEVFEILKTYQNVFFLHGYAYEDSVLAIGTYFKSSPKTGRIEPITVFKDIPPHLFSILDEDINSKRKNIKGYIENALTVALAHILHDLD